MATATLTPAQERALKRETIWETTPSPRLKEHRKEAEKQRQREVDAYLAEKKAGYGRAEAQIAEAQFERMAQHTQDVEVAQAAPPPPAPPSPPVVVPDVPFTPAPQNEPWGRLQPVRCPLEGYEGVVVHYRTNNKHGIIRNMPDFQSAGQATFYSWVNLFCKSINWPWAGVPPDLSTLEGWVYLEDQCEDLLSWMVGKGYVTAKEEALGGPSFQGNA